MAAAEDQILPAPRQSAKLFGHGWVVERIIGAQQVAETAQRLHHAWILAGPRGVGKATTAWMVARKRMAETSQTQTSAELFGKSSKDDTGFYTIDDVAGDENAGSHLVKTGSHPDVMVLERAADARSATISIEQVRKIGRFLSHRPARGAWRVAIIDPLDELSNGAANAMLKMLEEPPPQTLLLLVCHNLGRVLPTIRSRCQLLRLNRLEVHDTAVLLQQHWPDMDAGWQQLMLAVADGAPGMASIMAASGALELYAETLELIGSKTRDISTMDNLARRWWMAGGANAERRAMALALFDRLLSRAAVAACADADFSGPAKPQSASLPLEMTAVSSLAEGFTAADLAFIHETMIAALQRAETLNLDGSSILLNHLDKLCSRSLRPL